MNTAHCEQIKTILVSVLLRIPCCRYVLFFILNQVKFFWSVNRHSGYFAVLEIAIGKKFKILLRALIMRRAELLC